MHRKEGEGKHSSWTQQMSCDPTESLSDHITPQGSSWPLFSVDG